MLYVPTPGHTLGHSSVFFRTDDFDIIFAGDPSYHQDQVLNGILPGANTDYKKTQETYNNLLDYGGRRKTIYLPTHDGDAGTRLLNEEFLMGYKPITRKIGDAIYLMMAHSKPWFAVMLWSFLVIPVVYMAQVVMLAFATNLPVRLIVGAVLLAAAFIEELVKTVGIVVLAERGAVRSVREILWLSFLSALGFLIGEKLLVLVSVSVVAQAQVATALFQAGVFLLIPLAAHFVFVVIVNLLRIKLRFPYWLALALGTTLHVIYDAVILRGTI